MISILRTTEIRKVPYNDLMPAICELVIELFTLTGKYQDDEKVKMFGKSLAYNLPEKYPYLTVDQLEQIFKNAILGDFGALKSISLPDIFQWVRKWQETSKTGQQINFEPLATSAATSGDWINWSKECYKAYQRYRSKGLDVNEFSHFVYDRMLLDGGIPHGAYNEMLDKANELQPKSDSLELIYLAKKLVVLDKFARMKRDGVEEIYKAHKNDP